MPAKRFRVAAPATAAKAPGSANFATIPQSARLPTKMILNKLFARWTTAVAAIATWMGKKRAKAGISTVPRPNPEKNVEADTTNATEQTTAYSIFSH